MRLVSGSQTGGGAGTITAWASYTATLTNMGTSPSQSLFWRQVGENVEIYGSVTIGSSPPAAEGRIGLPGAFTADSTVLTIEPVGTWWFGASHAVHGGSILAQPSVAYLVFSNAAIFGSTTGNALASANTNTNFGAAEVMWLGNISVKITGLTT